MELERINKSMIDDAMNAREKEIVLSTLTKKKKRALIAKMIRVSFEKKGREREKAGFLGVEENLPIANPGTTHDQRA